MCVITSTEIDSEKRYWKENAIYGLFSIKRTFIVIPIITKREIYGCYPFESGPFPLDSTPLLVTFPFDSLRALSLRLEIDESGTFSAAQLVDNGAFSHVLKLFSAFYVPQIPFF